MDSPTIFAALRDALADIYPKEEDARIVAHDAGLDEKQIAFSTRAQTNWHNILAIAAHSGHFDTLLQIALDAYKTNPTLLVAYEQYCQLIEQGGHVEAPDQLPTGGDLVAGDKVQGDKLTTGNINAPAAIGRGASVTVIQQAPPLRIPLQRPPRAEHFQDRHKELAQLLADLQPGAVVTLCGPGGIGKTALAAEAVWQLAPGEDPPDRFPDGIIFHSFYNQGSAALALEAIARSFGEEPKPTPTEAARRALAGRQALLVLDGTEEADDLSAVLAVRDCCGVLVTSRKHNDAAAAWLDITPLPPSDAVILLQEWGSQRVTDTKTAGQICELVGRLPLAIRLAGRFLHEQAINEDEFLRWLEASPLLALDQGNRRLESISILIERSLTQVSKQARQVMGIVGVLAVAPFQRETIAQALGLSTAWEAMKPLGELVNYGLLIRQKEDYEVTHALIHTYARHHLAPPPEVNLRLVAHFTMFLNEHLHSLRQLAVVRFHVRALLDICVTDQAWEATINLAWAINGFLDLQGFYVDRITTIEAGLKAARATQNQNEEGAWLGSLGNAYAGLGQVEKAISYYEQALTIAKAIGDRSGEGIHLGGLGDAYRNLGQVEKAISYSEQALAIAHAISDQANEGTCLGNLGNVYAGLGEVEKAISYYEQALAIAQAIGDRRNEGVWLGNLGTAYADLGQLEKAISYYEQALAIAKAIGDRRGEEDWLGDLGNAYAGLGEVEKAISYYEQALAIAQAIGDRRGEGTTLGNLGNAYRNLGEVEKAISYYEQALAIAQPIGDRRNEGIDLGNLGNAYADLGQLEKAISYYEQALAIAQEIGDRRNEGAWMNDIGLAYADLGEVEKAISYLEQALVIAQAIGDRRNEGARLGNLGNTYRNLGEVEKAISYYEQALAIAKAIGDRRGEGTTLGNLGLAYRNLGEVEKAISYYEQALAIAHPIGDQRNEGVWLGNLGNAYADLGQVEKAISYYEQALAIAKAIGNQHGKGAWLGNLGTAYADLGQVEKAISYYEQALAIAQEIGDRHGQGTWLDNLGLAYSSLGQREKAKQYWKQALYIFEEIKSPTAEIVRQRLSELGER